MRRTSTCPRRELRRVHGPVSKSAHRVVAEESEAVGRERGAGRNVLEALDAAPQTSERTRCTSCSPVPAGIASATSSMPARAADSSVAASVSPSGRQPPRGGEIPAHVTVFTSGGLDIVTGRESSSPSSARARTMRSTSERIGTTDVEVLGLEERERAQAEHRGALVEDAARIEDRGVHREDAGARDQAHGTVFDAPGALQVGVQVAERKAVGERELLNHLLSKLPRERRRPGGPRFRRRPRGHRPTDTEER